MPHFLFIVRLIIAITSSISANEKSELRDFVKQWKQDHAVYDKLIAEKTKTVSELDEKRREVSTRIHWLQQAPIDSAQKQQLLDNIFDYSSWVQKYQELVEISQVTDPQKRSVMIQEFDKQRENLLREEGRAAKPYRKLLGSLQEKVKHHETPFYEIMKTYCLLPTDTYPEVVRSAVESQYYQIRGVYRWYDNQKKELAQARIVLRAVPKIPPKAKYLKDKYYIESMLLTNATVWTGQFRISFSVRQPEWHGREKMARMIEDFIDLEGLARVGDLSTSGKTVSFLKGAMECAKKYERISREKKEALQPLQADRVRVKALMHRLKNPVDSARIKKDKEKASYYQKSLENSKNRLKVSTIEDEQELQKQITHWKAEKAKLDKEKQNIEQPFDQKIVRLIRRDGLKQIMTEYVSEKSKIFSEPVQMSIRTQYYPGTITCTWTDKDDQKICTVKLRLLKPESNVNTFPRLHNLYPYYMAKHRHDFIILCLDDFQLCLQVYQKEWQNKEKIFILLDHLIDLHGLSNILMSPAG